MTNQEYRQLYKNLRLFFNFTFKLPHHTKEFSPQQKSSITRKYEKIRDYINEDFSIKKTEVSFLKYPKRGKLVGVDGVRTDKGIFYKWPNATVKKSKVEKNKYVVVILPKERPGAEMVKRRADIFIPFPKRVRHDPLAIAEFVNTIIEKYSPISIQWGYVNTRRRNFFDIEKLELYLTTDEPNDFTPVRELIEFVVKRYRNLLSSDKEKREKAQKSFAKSETYNLLSDFERRDFWAGLNYYRSARRDDFEYNGIFLVYYI